MYAFLHRTGSGVIEYLERLGGAFRLAVVSVFEIFLPPYDIRAVWREMDEIGSRSFWVVVAIGCCMGMVMVAQTGILLSRFSAEIYAAQLVSLSMFRELGPVLTGFMVAARAGSGMAAEIGSMQVSEQIDAMRACGASPTRLLVTPKVMASVIALPLLTAAANIAGVFGGMLAAAPLLELSPTFYLMSIPRAVYAGDFVSGLAKAFVFGLIIAAVSCNEGFRARYGSTGVRIATDRAVVMSCIGLLIADVLITAFIVTVAGFIWVS